MVVNRPGANYPGGAARTSRHGRLVRVSRCLLLSPADRTHRRRRISTGTGTGRLSTGRMARTMRHSNRQKVGENLTAVRDG